MSGSDPGPGSGRPGPGPWGEEAQRLLTAIQDWAQRTMPAPPSGDPGPECHWCPLCQFASLLRGEHPELGERVAEAGTAVTGALRALLDAAAKHAPPPAEAADQARAAQERAAQTADRPRPAPRVEHIRLDEPG